MLDVEDVVTTRNFSAQLVEEVLWVAFIPKNAVKLCAWPLIRAMFLPTRSETDECPNEGGDGGADDEGRFLSVTHDDDGVSIVMDDTCKRTFDDFPGAHLLTYAPRRWRAFEIHLGTSALPGCVRLGQGRLARLLTATDAPGALPRSLVRGRPCRVVCLLSSMLGDANISILNLSTYNSDFLLVQDKDSARAAELIRERLRGGMQGLNDQLRAMRLAKSPLAHCVPPGEALVDRGSGEDSAELSEKGTVAGYEEGRQGLLQGVDSVGASAAIQGLLQPAPAAGGSAAELPSWVTSAAGAARSQGGPGRSAIEANADQLYLKGAWRCRPRLGGPGKARGAAPLGSPARAALPSLAVVLGPTLTVARLNERCADEVSCLLMRVLLFEGDTDGGAGSTFWSYAHTADGYGDMSIIMEAGLLDRFPEGTIVGDCALWRAVKLCGHDFAFDETGVVSAMLHGVCKEGLPVLNLSTFATNMTIVEAESVDQALKAFEVVSRRVVWEGEASP